MTYHDLRAPKHKIADLSTNDLKNVCKAADLDHLGTKQELIQRIAVAFRDTAGEAWSPEDRDLREWAYACYYAAVERLKPMSRREVIALAKEYADPSILGDELDAVPDPHNSRVWAVLLNRETLTGLIVDERFGVIDEGTFPQWPPR